MFEAYVGILEALHDINRNMRYLNVQYRRGKRSFVESEVKCKGCVTFSISVPMRRLKV